jgi:1,4-dihydroxy-2-naphthoate octaprenyltransferase
MTDVRPERVTRLKKWLIAGRPWALPASTMPVLFGTSLAVVIGGAGLDVPGFLAALLAMMALHTAANMLSDVFDFKRGLDRDVTPVSGAIVRGWLSPKQVTAGSIFLFAFGSFLGIVLVLRTGAVVFWIGAAGVAVGASYSFLKFRALGDLAVFLNFGILGSLGAWVVQTKTLSWLPVVWAVPMAMLVIGILHANNWRDIVMDSGKEVITMACLLKDRGSLVYYGVLLFGSMALIILFVCVPRVAALGLPALPPTFLIVFVALPKALGLWKRALKRHAPQRPMDFAVLDGATAAYNLLFGLLCTAALWLEFALKKMGVYR